SALLPHLLAVLQRAVLLDQRGDAPAQPRHEPGQPAIPDAGPTGADLGDRLVAPALDVAGRRRNAAIEPDAAVPARPLVRQELLELPLRDGGVGPGALGQILVDARFREGRRRVMSAGFFVP